MNPPCHDPVPLEALIAYHLGELDAAREDAVEAHYFGCASCAGRLEAVSRLGAGLVAVVREGLVSASVSAGLVSRGIADGLNVRSYRVEPGQQVACTAAPEDDFVAIRLGLPGAAAGSIDVDVELTDLASGAVETRVISQVLRDRDTEEIVLLFGGPQVRAFPRSRWRMEAVLTDDAGERRVGPYTLEHTPWDERPSPE